MCGDGEKCKSCTCESGKKMTPQEITAGERSLIDAMIWMLEKQVSKIAKRMVEAAEVSEPGYLAGLDDARRLIEEDVEYGKSITNAEIMRKVTDMRKEDQLPAVVAACGMNPRGVH